MNEETKNHILHCGCETIEIELQAIQRVKNRLDESFIQAVEIILQAKGRVIVSGMGKSGHVARKIAATLSSTGTTSYFVHPAEASHGDLGMITPEDILIAVSNSGETHELTTILPVIKRLGAKTIAITGNGNSSLAKNADVVLDSSVEKEACPLNLAPTASTTAQLVLGDALAMALLDARGFKAEDFARSHPGGALGRKLLTHVKDVMRPLSETPIVMPDASFSEVMLEMTKKGLGMTSIVNANNQAVGVFTDGDLRRLLDKLDSNQKLHDLQAQDIMKGQPKTVFENALATEAAQMMEQKEISQVLVVDANDTLVGVINTHDLMRAKVI